jgi:hypothetical protein
MCIYIYVYIYIAAAMRLYIFIYIHAYDMRVVGHVAYHAHIMHMCIMLTCNDVSDKGPPPPDRSRGTIGRPVDFGELVDFEMKNRF